MVSVWQFTVDICLCTFILILLYWFQWNTIISLVSYSHKVKYLSYFVVTNLLATFIICFSFIIVIDHTNTRIICYLQFRNFVTV